MFDVTTDLKAHKIRKLEDNGFSNLLKIRKVVIRRYEEGGTYILYAIEAAL
jgi:hypothetical protein